MNDQEYKALTLHQARKRLPEPSYAVDTDGLYLLAYYLYQQDESEIADPLAKNGPAIEVAGSNILRLTEGPSVEFGDHINQDWFPPNAKFPDRTYQIKWYPAEAPAVNWSPPADPSTAVWQCRGFSFEEASDKRPPRMIIQAADDALAAARGDGDE